MQDFIDSLRRLLSFNTDYLRLRLAEKITDAISIAMLYAIVAFAVFMAIVLLSVGTGLLLAKVMPGWAAFMCVALLYIVGLVPLLAFRQKLFSNGISRIVTRLLVNPPNQEDEKE